MINFSRLLDLNFWFALRPTALSKQTTIVLVAGFGIFLLTAVILGFLAKIKKQNPPLAKLLRKLKKMFSVMAVVGFILLFFSYEQIYLLGSRFWFLLWFIGLVVWLVFILLYAVGKMPKEKDDLEKKQKYLKYLK
jgi:glucan phosphoethanolaminetransferase (alkaline phosphatase superfamily)